ncbi:hypothetical protein [Lysobacter antibioticus]|uniref:hypothetical protein n=1 Tax=Lysobacter antibioticus TaxID=84531 RepID=UPI00034BC7B5|nr:hypothetical protein [Lysobacter antibioticus]
MATAGSIVVDLLMRTGSFITDSARAEKQMKQLEKAAHSLGRSIGSSITSNLAGMAAGFLSLQAGLQFFKGVIDQADKIDEMSAKLKISTEMLSGLGYAAKLSGTDLETLDGAIVKISRNMAEALDKNSKSAALFKALGISVTDAAGKLRSVDAVLPEIADRFAALNNQTLETSLAMELAGRSGADLLEFFNRGSQGLRSLREEAASIGAIISPEEAERAAAFKDELDRLVSLIQGAGRRIASEFLPQLEKLAIATEDWIKDGDKAAELADNIGRTFEFTAGAAKLFGGALDLIGDKIEGLSEGLYGLNIAARGVFSLDFGKVREGLIVAGEGARLNLFGDNKKNDKKIRDPRIVFAGSGKEPPNFFAKDVGQVMAEGEVKALNDRIQKLLSGDGKAPKGGKGKDPAAEMARQARALKEMQRAADQWAAELDGRSNPALENYKKRLDEITDSAEKFKEDGLSTGKIEEFSTKMKGLAEALKLKELSDLQKQFEFDTRAIAASVTGVVSPALVKYEEDLRAIDKQLNDGVVTQEQYQKRLEAITAERHQNATQMFKDYQFEIDLLGQTREAQELLNAVRYLGADAATAQGEAAIAALKEYQDLRKLIDDQVTAMDGLRDASRGFFHDLKEGEGILDSLKNAADRFADVLFDLAANNVVERIFGQQGSAGGGSAGWLGKIVGLFTGGGGGGASAAPSASFAGSFGNNFGWLFGGGKAGGGDVFGDRAYLVGEMGPELFVPRTAGSVLPADMTRTALRQGSDSSNTVNQTFITTGDNSRRTAQQQAYQAGAAARRAMSRNGR